MTADSILPGPPASIPAIVELIPHRPPMVFVDALLAATETTATCSFTIGRATACLRDGQLPAIYAVESMAQAAAAHLGALARWRGEAPQGGYLVGVRDVGLRARAFAPGDVLTIEVRRSFGADRLASYECRALRAGIDVASATLNVLRNPA